MIATSYWFLLRHARLCLWLVALLGLVACGPQLRSAPDAKTGDAAQLAGNWLMQEAEREQLLATLRTALQQAEAKQQRRQRREQRNQPPPEGGSDAGVVMPAAMDVSGMGGMPMGNNWEQRERQEQQESLLQAVVPSRSLHITQQGNSRIELIPDSAAVRRFVVGETSTLVTSYDTLKLYSGWQSNDFVVYATGKEQSLKVTERYRRNANQLLVTVTITMSGFKSQTLQAHYQRG